MNINCWNIPRNKKTVLNIRNYYNGCNLTELTDTVHKIVITDYYSHYNTNAHGRRLSQQIGSENVTTADRNNLITVQKTEKHILTCTNNFRLNSLLMTANPGKLQELRSQHPLGCLHWEQVDPRLHRQVWDR